MIAFELAIASVPDDARVVDLVSRNYASYAEARANSDRAAWVRREAGARSGDALAIREYLLGFRDPALRLVEPPAPPSPKAFESRRIDFLSGPEEVRLIVGPGYREKRFNPNLSVPAFGPSNIDGLMQVATRRAPRHAALDLRGYEELEPTAYVLLGLLFPQRTLTEPGLDVLATAENQAAWEVDVAALPGGEATLQRMKRAKAGTFVRATEDGTVRMMVRGELSRLAILVGPDTPPSAGRFASLAQRSPRVRVFGSETPPIGERGVRRFDVGADRYLLIPTIRRRGGSRVQPDEEFDSLPPAVKELPADIVRFRADQWCRLGE